MLGYERLSKILTRHGIPCGRGSGLHVPLDAGGWHGWHGRFHNSFGAGSSPRLIATGSKPDLDNGLVLKAPDTLHYQLRHRIGDLFGFGMPFFGQPLRNPEESTSRKFGDGSPVEIAIAPIRYSC